MPKVTPENVNVVNTKGENALICAIGNLVNVEVHKTILPFLITDVSIKQQDNNNGWSSLIYAIYCNRHYDIIKLLICPETVNLVCNDGNALYMMLKYVDHYCNINNIISFNILKLLARPENVNYIRKGKSMLYMLLSKINLYKLLRINEIICINIIKLFITEQTLKHKYLNQTIFQFINNTCYPKSNVSNFNMDTHVPMPYEIFDLLKMRSKIYTITISDEDGVVISTQRFDLS